MKEELKPTIKLIFWPLIFVWWCLYRMTHVRYVTSPSFREYLEQL